MVEIVHGRNCNLFCKEKGNNKDVVVVVNYNITWGRKCNHGRKCNIKVEKFNVIKVEKPTSK